MAKGENGGQGFERSGGPDGVPVQGFGGTDGDVGGAGAEELVDGGGFRGVVGLGTGAVGVDVVHLVNGSVGVGKSFAHGGGCAFGGRLGDVVSIGRHAKADDLGIDGGVASLG